MNNTDDDSGAVSAAKTRHGGQEPSGAEPIGPVEQAHIDRRRRQFNLVADHGLAGLALSGGGIRSATFSFGFLQGLSTSGLLPRFDYISTVSGGSYIGSFLGALYMPSALRGRDPDAKNRPNFDAYTPLQSPLGIEAIKRLRESGRYLAPSGTSDAFYGAAIVARNWVTLQLAFGLAALLGFWALRCLDQITRKYVSVGAVAIGPTLLILIALATSAALATGAAYWCTRRDYIPANRAVRILTNLYFWGVVFVLAYALSSGWLDRHGLALFGVPQPWVAAFIALTAALAIAFDGIAEGRQGKVGATTAGPEKLQQLNAAEDKVRTWLSRRLSTSLVILLALVALLAIDAAGSVVAGQAADLVRSFTEEGISAMFQWRNWAQVGPAIVTLAPPLISFAVHALSKRRRPRAKPSKTKKEPDEPSALAGWLPALILLAGLSLAAFWLLAWSVVSHLPFALWPVGDVRSRWILLALFCANLAISLSFSFINLSSLSTFYAARLRRAYIGASSYRKDSANVSVDAPQDAIAVENYYKGLAEGFAPVHLINVTIAETRAGGSNLVARDRKGKPMVLTPDGFVFQDEKPGDFLRKDFGGGEPLPLANWIAISGAAVAAAIGSGSSVGKSILVTLANVRLGYWWKQSRTTSMGSGLWSGRHDYVQNYLLNELRGAFDGTRRSRWYLTDGGHFDNTGIYALLQRKVPLIVACDNGADPTYQLADLVRLIGRARTDLGAHIDFLDDDQIRKIFGQPSPREAWIGEIAGFAGEATQTSPGPIAAAATIDYSGDERRGLLLLVKPRLTAHEPPELLAYRSRPGCRDFPQQTTVDQFFDEEQWEAYRQLGELAATRLFGPKAPHPCPADLLPPASTSSQASTTYDAIWESVRTV